MAKRIESLEDVKAKLYEVFNEAAENHSKYEDRTKAGNGISYDQPANFKVENRAAIGVLGSAIAEVEREIREVKQRSPMIKDRP